VDRKEYKIYNDRNEVIIDIIDLSKKLRKLIYGLKNQTYKYMLFDILIDNMNNLIILK